jgi:hypothetical protein
VKQGSAFVALALTLLVGGCGVALTYDEALQVAIHEYGYRFEPPDSVAYAAPEIPEVYDVVFAPGIIATRDSLEARELAARQVVLRSARPDTVYIFVPDTTSVADAPTPTAEAAPETIQAPLPPVRVELAEQERDRLVAAIERDTRRTLEILRGIPESQSTAEQIGAVRGLLAQTYAARDSEDYRGAANLAGKARLLAEDLASSQP